MESLTLAFEMGDLPQLIGLLIIALASGLGHMFKKKKKGGERDDDKTIIIAIPPEAGTRPKLPASPAQRLATPRRPPQARPSAPKARTPRPGQQPVRPQAPARPRRIPVRPPQPAVHEHVTQDVAQFSEDIARHFEQKASPVVKRGQVVAEAAAVEERSAEPDELRQLIKRLNPRTMRQAVLLSEILQPPIGLRETAP